VEVGGGLALGDIAGPVDADEEKRHAARDAPLHGGEAVAERAKKEGLPLAPFTVHDLRRTGSTLLNELGFNSDWIEKCLAQEDVWSSRGIYNKAEY